MAVERDVRADPQGKKACPSPSAVSGANESKDDPHG